MAHPELVASALGAEFWQHVQPGAAWSTWNGLHRPVDCRQGPQQENSLKGHPGLHGTAHHLTEQDVRATGLLPNPKKPRPGIVVGGWTDRKGTLRYLVHSGREHALCLGPTRSGKTAGVLIPTLLTYPHSVVIYDPKGELYARTAGWREREAGNTIIRFAPADAENTARWNPFDRVRAGTPYEFRDVANIIEQVADPKGKGLSGHWEPTAANFMAGVALHLFTLMQRASFGEMLEIIDDPTRDPADLLAKMMKVKIRRLPKSGAEWRARQIKSAPALFQRLARCSASIATRLLAKTRRTATSALIR